MNKNFLNFFVPLISLICEAESDPGPIQESQVVKTLQKLTESCDQTKNYVGILEAVHNSLDLQRRLTDLEEQVSKLEYQLSENNGVSKTRREIFNSNNDVYFRTFCCLVFIS